MSTIVADTWWMTARRLKVSMGQPAYLIITLIQPVIWLFLFGNLFERVVDLGGFGTTSYLDYLVPGVLVMNALAVNMWAGMGTLEEIERGTLNRFLTTPVRRTAIMNANVVEQALGTTVQSVVIVALGWLAGATYPGGLGGVVILILAAVLLGTIFGALSNVIGMLVRQRESIIGINTFLLLPLTFLSTVFMVKELMPGWMQGIAEFNPLNWAVVAGRSALSTSPDWGLVTSRGGWLLGLAVAMVALSVRTFRTYQKAV
jgi:ABC-2 type transport system permease protein